MLLSLDTKPDDQQRSSLLDLRDPDAGLLHLRGQQRHGELQLVLHLHLRDVGIGPRREGERGDRPAEVVAGRGHVDQAVEPVHLLLDHLDDGVLDGGAEAPG